MDRTPLPRIMVAPNGARRGRADHPALPLTDDELVETAIACREAGADGLHAHIRDADGVHLLDAGRYRALLERLADAVPGMYIQVTSEAAGRYGPVEQQAIMRRLCPAHVSVAFREMVRDECDWPEAAAFYAWAADADVDVQHIVYSTDELIRFIHACDAGRIPGRVHPVQIVLGSYDGSQVSRPEAVCRFVELMEGADMRFDWMFCAFGREETACLVEAARLGGKVRVGFENSLWNGDGSLARDNAERVREVRTGIAALG